MEKTKDGIKCDLGELKLELIRSLRISLRSYADDKDKQQRINKEIDFWKSEIRKSKTGTMNKTKDDIKQKLKEQWKQACNGYLVELLRMWELDAHYGYWVGDETGTMYCYGETHNLSMEEIMYIVDCDIEEDEVIEWEDYQLMAHEFGFSLPNLMAWHRGCPRTPKAVFDKLQELKADLDKAVEKEKERIKNAKS